MLHDDDDAVSENSQSHDSSSCPSVIYDLFIRNSGRGRRL